MCFTGRRVWQRHVYVCVTTTTTATTTTTTCASINNGHARGPRGGRGQGVGSTQSTRCSGGASISAPVTTSTAPTSPASTASGHGQKDTELVESVRRAREQRYRLYGPSEANAKQVVADKIATVDKELVLKETEHKLQVAMFGDDASTDKRAALAADKQTLVKEAKKIVADADKAAKRAMTDQQAVTRQLKYLVDDIRDAPFGRGRPKRV